jgi:hypothetical protein
MVLKTKLVLFLLCERLRFGFIGILSLNDFLFPLLSIPFI